MTRDWRIPEKQRVKKEKHEKDEKSKMKKKFLILSTQNIYNFVTNDCSGHYATKKPFFIALEMEKLA